MRLNKICVKVFLIGLMGSGKTYWAVKLGALLNIHVFDLDKEIEKSENKNVAEIFAEKGEDYFRMKENEILKSFANKKHFVLSTGGGAPCFYDNMEWMNLYGITVWIDDSIEKIVERLVKEKSHRPLIAALNDNELNAFLTDMLNKRRAFYSQAKIHLNGNNINEEYLLKIISPHE
jgi:shikimate kinase